MFELPHNAKRFSIPALIAGAFLFSSYVLPAMFAHHKPPFNCVNCHSFNSEQWKFASSHGGYYLANSSMLDDFISRYKLVGLSRRQLHELLGCEGLTTQKVERQQLQAGGCIDQSQLFLEVEFDDFWQKNPLEQKALRFRLITHKYRPFDAGGDREIGSDWYN